MYDLIFQFMARYAHCSLRDFCSTDDHLLLLHVIVRVITFNKLSNPFKDLT